MVTEETINQVPLQPYQGEDPQSSPHICH